MNSAGVGVAVVGLFVAAFSVVAQSRDVCDFLIIRERPTVKFAGSQEILSRIHLLKQPDSPVAVVTADFSEANLTLGGGWVTFAGPYRVDIVNVSDQVIDEVHVRVGVRSRHGGFGGGVRWKSQLNPGMRTRLNRGRGQGQGTAPDEVVELMISIESVRFRGCEYRPATALPPLDK
jgi:hypothetical protein